MNELARIALVGTARHAADMTADGDSPADALAARLTAADREERLLLRAGMQAVCSAAGYVPHTDLPPLEPSPSDAAPRGSGTLAGILQNALATGSNELWVEFLGQMGGCGVLLPAELLPEALDITDAQVRARLLPLLGERGRWLSRFNPQWSWVHSGAATLSAADREALRQAWEESGIRERCDVLITLRRSDPAEARDWLKATIGSEKAEHRARLLDAFEQGLTMEDEPFLETCLDDRSFAVRQSAATLLARLPSAALTGRMRARADAMLAAEKKGLIRKTLKLTCTPPEAIDKTWERDGVPARAPAGRGKRAFWAELALGMVRPAHWTARFGAEAGALIKGVCDDPFEEAVLVGWTRAACRFSAVDDGAAAWLGPLWDFWAGAAQRETGAGRTAACEQLKVILGRLPQPEAESALLRVLAPLRTSADAEPLGLLSELPRPWSGEFGQQYVQIVRGILRKFADNRAYQWSNTLFVAARALPRETFTVALEPWEISGAGSKDWSSQAVQRETDKFTETIRMRQSFYEELASHL